MVKQNYYELVMTTLWEAVTWLAGKASIYCWYSYLVNLHLKGIVSLAMFDDYIWLPEGDQYFTITILRVW